MSLLLGPKKDEKVVPLGDVKYGDVFRFEHVAFHDAMFNGLMFMRLNANNGEKRIYVCSIDGKECRLFDAEHRVVIHRHDFVIYP